MSQNTVWHNDLIAALEPRLMYDGAGGEALISEVSDAVDSQPTETPEPTEAHPPSDDTPANGEADSSGDETTGDPDQSQEDILSPKNNGENTSHGTALAQALATTDAPGEEAADSKEESDPAPMSKSSEPQPVMMASAPTPQGPDDIVVNHLNILPGHGLTPDLGECLDDISQIDDSFKRIDITDTLPGGLSLFGKTYDSIYVGTNGYITLGHSQTSFNPLGIPGYDKGPMIAAMFDDMFNREGDPGKIYVHKDTEKNIVTITWKNMKWFNDPALKQGDISDGNSFQIRLHGMGKGNFGIEIRYDNICWGGGAPNAASQNKMPTAGWTAGDQTNFGVVTGSGSADFLNVEDHSNIGQAGVFAWLVRGGEITPFNTGIYENSPEGTVAARLTATDPDTPSSDLVLSIKNDPSGKFEMVKNGEFYEVRLKNGASIDYETTAGHQWVITVEAKDPEGNTFEEDIPIQVFDVNDNPEITGADNVTGNEDSPIQGTLSATDGDNDPLNWNITQAPNHGSFNLSPSGQWSYTPNLNFNGSDSFTIQVNDGNGGIVTKTISLTISPVNDTPVFSGSDHFVSEPRQSPQGKLPLVDVDGDTITWTVKSQGQSGQVVVDEHGNWHYSPSSSWGGVDSFILQGSDGNGGVVEKEIHVDIKSDVPHPIEPEKPHNTQPNEIPVPQEPQPPAMEELSTIEETDPPAPQAPFMGEVDLPKEAQPESTPPGTPSEPTPAQNIRVTAQGEILMPQILSEDFLSVSDMVLDRGQLEVHIDYHGETSSSVLYSATLEDGKNLPSWLTIDPTTGIITGTPPDGIEEIRLHVVATIHGTDSKALDVTIEFDADEKPAPMAAEGEEPSLPSGPATGALPLSSQLDAIELPPSGREVAQALMAS